MSEITVVERKQAFLRRQKHILTRGIQPSNRLFRIAEQGGIQDKILSDVLMKVNRDLKRHGRTVYSSQMTNHIAHQIDLTYWEAGAPTLDEETDAGTDAGEEDPNALYLNDDLTLDKHIAKLPSTWDTSADSHVAGGGNIQLDHDKYMDAVVRLQDLTAQRLTLQQKLNTYRTLLSLLEPYRKPQETIQPNLVGRDAPLAVELAQTRTLAIRVAGRISEKSGEVLSNVEEVDMEMLQDDGKRKLEDILASW